MVSVLRPFWDEAAIEVPRKNPTDLVVAIAVLTGVLVEVLVRRDLVWPPVALLLGMTLAVLARFRRRFPLAAVVVGFGTIAVIDIATQLTGNEPQFLYSALVVLLFIYSLFRWGASREAIVGLAVAAFALVTAVVTDYNGVADAVGGAVTLLFGAALGGAVRYRAVARAQLVDQARLQERSELARELHDTVAHHVSAIAIQAQAGLFVARSASPADAIDALQTIEREAAATLAEMRSIVSVLREGGSPLKPVPRIADIETFARNGAGMLDVDVVIDGDPAGLTPAAQAALYRVAQESLTNARRHAVNATRATIAITVRPDRVRMTVTDDGVPTNRPRSAIGHGLAGMAERMQLLGGTFHAGPTPHGWTVTAELPHERAVL